MAKRRSGRRWIQRALGVRYRRKGLGPHHYQSVRKEARKKGALHRQLGIPAGEKIPLATLRWAVKQGGLLGKRAQFALNVRGLGHKRSR